MSAVTAVTAVTLCLQAGLVTVAAVLHSMVTPVNNKYFDLSQQIEEKEEATRTRTVEIKQDKK